MATYQLLRKEATVPVSGKEPVVQSPVRHSQGAQPQGDGMGSELDARMQARMQRFLENQNPQAEQEADDIAASLSTARTPQEVKAQLGERMGADFSAVRFHTDADALQKAEGIGARAYATGRDVYFGEGGFDPVVAAHELVHTAQQGVVESGMATQTMAAGTVQMMPKWWPFGKKEKRQEAAAPQPAPSRALSEKEQLAQRRAENNSRLSQMGAERIEQVLSGQGNAADNREFQEIMSVLNGAVGSGELSQENLQMLYGAGGKSREFVVNRTQNNMVNHIQRIYDQQKGEGAYNKTGQEHGDFMATLQNSAVRQGNGGAIQEYSDMLRLMIGPGVADNIIENDMLGKMPEGLTAADRQSEAFKGAAKDQSDQVLQHISEQLADNGALQDYNGQFMEKLRATMPEAFSDEATSRAFVSKGTMLRGVMPGLSANDPRVMEDEFAKAISQQTMLNANRMLDKNVGISRMTPVHQQVVNSTVSGFARQPGEVAPVPARPEARPAPLGGRKTSDQTFGYRTATPTNGGEGATQDEILAGMYQNMQDPSLSEEERSLRRRHFAQARAQQMDAEWRAQQQAQQPATPKKKKWYQFWK